MNYDYFVQGVYDGSVAWVFTFSFDSPLESSEIIFLQIVSNIFASRFSFLGHHKVKSR